MNDIYQLPRSIPDLIVQRELQKLFADTWIYVVESVHCWIQKKCFRENRTRNLERLTEDVILPNQQSNMTSIRPMDRCTDLVSS